MKQTLEFRCEEDKCHNRPNLAVIAVKKDKEYAKYYTCSDHLGSVGCKMALLFRPLGYRISARQMTYEEKMEEK